MIAERRSQGLPASDRATVILMGSNPGPVRALVNAGAAVMVVDETPPRRRVPGASYRQLAGLDAGREDEAWVHQLRELGTELSHDRPRPLLFPMTDRSLLAVARQHERLAERLTVVAPAPHVVELLLDKVGFAVWAEQHGLPVPRSRVFRAVPAQGPIDLDGLPLPLVVKPSHTHELERTSRIKLFHATTRDQAARQVREVLAHGMTAVVQEDLSGAQGTSTQWSLAGITALDGTVPATVLAEKLRQVRWGAGTAVETMPMDERIRDIALAAVRAAGRLPIFEVELRADASGQPRLIEINPRIWTQARLPQAAGLDLLDYARRIAGGYTGPVPQRYRAGVGWCSWRRDARVALGMLRRRQLDVRHLLTSLTRVRVLD
jgi:predicted ATP-grasp superfamily ATP-dependent carboligase